MHFANLNFKVYWYFLRNTVTVIIIFLKVFNRLHILLHLLLFYSATYLICFPDSSVGKESTCKAGDPGSILVLGRSPGEGIDNPRQYSWASLMTSLVTQLVKNLCNAEDLGSMPQVGKIPWRREQLPSPVFWPGEFQGLSSPWGRKELDMTEGIHFHFHFHQVGINSTWSERGTDHNVCNKLFNIF